MPESLSREPIGSAVAEPQQSGALTPDPQIAVCFCGMPYVPSDPDVTHLVHYQCVFCREEDGESLTAQG